MAEGKKKKKKKPLILSIIFGEIFILLFVMMGSAGGGAIITAEGELQDRINKQTSRSENYLNNYSEQQLAIAKMAEDECSAREETGEKGGDRYIKELDPDMYEAQKKNQTTFDKKNNRPLTVKWGGFFAGYVMKKCGIELEDWSYMPAVFATKLNNAEKLVLPENYIPRKGDIIFFGKPLKNLSAGMTVKANYCGIVTDVEAFNKKTEIQAIRITVAEGCVDLERAEGNLHYGLSYLRSYQYDLYDTQGNDHHGITDEYEPIMCYATVAEDAEKPESTDNPKNKEDLVYTINLISTYEAAMAQQKQKE